MCLDRIHCTNVYDVNTTTNKITLKLVKFYFPSTLYVVILRSLQSFLTLGSDICVERMKLSARYSVSSFVWGSFAPCPILGRQYIELLWIEGKGIAGCMTLHFKTALPGPVIVTYSGIVSYFVKILDHSAWGHSNITKNLKSPQTILYWDERGYPSTLHRMQLMLYGRVRTQIDRKSVV